MQWELPPWSYLTITVGGYPKFTRICVRVWEGQDDRLTKVPISVVRMCDCKNVSVGDLWELLSPSTS